MSTLTEVFQELGVTNFDDALAEIIKLKLGYQPWRDRRGELLSKPVLTDADRQELKEVEAKLMPLGWRAKLGRSHEDTQTMEIIRAAAKLLKKEVQCDFSESKQVLQVSVSDDNEITASQAPNFTDCHCCW